MSRVIAMAATASVKTTSRSADAVRAVSVGVPVTATVCRSRLSQTPEPSGLTWHDEPSDAACHDGSARGGPVTAAVAERAGLTYRSSVGRWVLVACVGGSVITQVDANAVGIALPAIGRDFHLGWERKARQPVLPLRLFASTRFTTTNLV